MSSTSVESLQGKTGSSRIANLGRLLLAAMCVSLVTVAAAPKALAAAPNGVYEFTSASGTVKFGDNTIDIPESAVKRIAGVVNGDITIQNKTLQLNRNATKKIVKELGDELDFDVKVTVTGPTSVTLSKDVDIYIGSTEEPIVTSFEGDFHGEDFSGELITDVTAKVKGKTLRLIITFSGETLGEEFSGKLVIVAKR
ncbi:MAG: hypothetical protein V4689_09955 [Verrucomicrobiota bacterium]